MNVVPLVPDQLDDAARLLTRALMDDPASIHHFPDPGTRSRKLQWYHRWLLQIGSAQGLIDATDSELAGVAVWMPPGAERIKLRTKLSSGLLSAPLTIGPGATRRVLRSMSALDSVHLQTLPGKHWYLVVVGVDPDHQGRGVGSALMRHALARADQQGMACYLETTSRASRKTFQQFGFEVVGELAGIPGLPTWTMVRKPEVPEKDPVLS